MNLFLKSLGNLEWLLCAVIIAVSTLMLIVAVRSRSVSLTKEQKRRETTWVLLGSLTAFVLMSGGIIWQQAGTASPTRAHLEPTLTLIPSPLPSPTPTPSPQPSPTPTPTLARSITTVVTTFCQAITAHDYQTAWQQYGVQLQQAHPQRETFAAWRKFAHCSIPDQSADPSAWTIFTLTLLDGQTDNRRIGDVDYRATMSIESNTWKIAKVCQIMSEGCFAISWG